MSKVELRPGYWLAIVVLAVDELLFLAIVPLLPYYAKRFGLSERDFSLLLATYPLMMLIAGLPASFVVAGLGEWTVIAVGMVGFAASVILLALATVAADVFVSRALLGLFSAVTLTATMMVVARSKPSSTSGEAIGTAFLAVGAGALAAPLLGGVLVPAIGAKATFLGLAVCVGALALLVGRGAFRAGRAVETTAPISRRMSWLMADRSAVGGAIVMVTSGFLGTSTQALGVLSLEHDGFSTRSIAVLVLAGGVAGFLGSRALGRAGDRFGATSVAIGTAACAAGITAVLGLGVVPSVQAAAFGGVIAATYWLGVAAYLVSAAEEGPQRALACR